MAETAWAVAADETGYVWYFPWGGTNKDIFCRKLDPNGSSVVASSAFYPRSTSAGLDKVFKAFARGNFIYIAGTTYATDNDNDTADNFVMRVKKSDCTPDTSWLPNPPQGSSSKALIWGTANAYDEVDGLYVSEDERRLYVSAWRGVSSGGTNPTEMKIEVHKFYNVAEGGQNAGATQWEKSWHPCQNGCNGGKFDTADGDMIVEEGSAIFIAGRKGDCNLQTACVGSNPSRGYVAKLSDPAGSTAPADPDYDQWDDQALGGSGVDNAPDDALSLAGDDTYLYPVGRRRVTASDSRQELYVRRYAKNSTLSGQSEPVLVKTPAACGSGACARWLFSRSISADPDSDKVTAQPQPFVYVAATYTDGSSQEIRFFRFTPSDFPGSGTGTLPDPADTVSVAGQHGIARVGGVLWVAGDTPGDGNPGNDPFLASFTATPTIFRPASPIQVGSTTTIYGGKLTNGTVLKIFLVDPSTQTGIRDVSGADGIGSATVPNGTQWTKTLPWPWNDSSATLGAGAATLRFVRTDQGYDGTNEVTALIYGNDQLAQKVPTITALKSKGLAATSLWPGYQSNVEDVASIPSTLEIDGSGFVSPAVMVYHATGSRQLTPSSSSASHITVSIPSDAPTISSGTGSFQVKNVTLDNRTSQAVSMPLGAVVNVNSVQEIGATCRIRVTGTGFSYPGGQVTSASRTAINFFASDGTSVVNLGSFNGDGTPKIKLDITSSTQFEFCRPAGAVNGSAYVTALNPPFIAWDSSDHPDRLGDGTGAFTLTNTSSCTCVQPQ